MSRVLKLPSITTRKPQSVTMATTQAVNNEYPFHDKIGQRVSIPSMNLTGTLRYVGQPEFKKGIWAGIELAESQGKNDGSVQGVRYFTCPPNCGIFIGVGKIVLLMPTPSPPLPPPPSATPPKPSTSTRRSNLPLIPNASSSSTTSSSSNSRASKTMLKRPGSRTPSQSTTHLPKKPSKTLTHKPSKTFTKRSHHLRVSSVPSESTTPSSSTLPLAQANSVSNMPKRESLKSSSTTSPSPQLVKRESLRSSTTTATSSSTPPPSPPIQYEEELNQLKKQLEDCHDALDKMKREKQTLQTQMKAKETAWERLVSSKESLSLQVEEKTEQQNRLQRELSQLQDKLERLEMDIADKDASIAKNIRNDEKQSQDQRRIERLEGIVKELSEQLDAEKNNFLLSEREHAGHLDQVRREVTASESMTAALEKECADLRRAGLEAITAYEQSVMQINEQKEILVNERDEQIKQLNHIISELKRKQSILFDDEEEEDEHTDMLKSAYSDDQRHRLEEQLELTMAELDHERLVIKSMVSEMEQLKAEAVQLRQQKKNAEERFISLQTDFEKELQDKKRLIEEADAAFEAQARAEDEHYQCKLEKMAIEKELAYYREEEKLKHRHHQEEEEKESNDELMKKGKQELINMNKQLEKDCIKLMDEILALEKQVENNDNQHITTATAGDDNSIALQDKINKLEKENETHRRSLSQLELEKKTQVNQLSRDLAELESLVENKVFGEADLEEKLEKERKRVHELEQELKKLKTSQRNTLSSPIDTTTTVTDEEKYCALCFETGHDATQCKSTTTTKSPQQEEDEESLYCENCDDYGLHSTEHCPNQDETF